jgi:hypothetical protein
MKNLTRFGAAIILTLVLGLSALAGEVETPPCTPPVPGEVETPPCASQKALDDSVRRNETIIASSIAIEISITDAGLDILQRVLSLF